MSLKTTHIKYLKDFNNEREQTIKQIDTIIQSENLTDSGKENSIKLLQDDLKKKGKELAPKLYKAIDQSINRAKEKGYDKLNSTMRDSGYQAGLTNLINGIKNGAFDYDEIQKIANECYSEDMFAIKLINKALLEQDMLTLFYFDKSKVVRKLESYRGNISKFIENQQGINNFAENVAIDGLITFVTDNLDDELNYIVE